MPGFSDQLLDGRTVLVTGAGKGLGLGCAEAVLNAGGRLVVVARTASDLEALVERAPDRVEAWAMDVTSGEFLDRLRCLDRLDGLINNAGTNRVGLMEQQDAGDLDAVLNLNVRALWLTSQAALPPMQRAGGGSIVNMSSQMGHVGSPRRTLYCMSKHAVEGLTKAMAVELAESGIRVNSVAPTFVLTEMTRPMMEDEAFSDFIMGMIPSRQLATVDDVANASVFLLSDLSASTTGSCLKIDRGWTAH